jgi:hypothetical protein
MSPQSVAPLLPAQPVGGSQRASRLGRGSALRERLGHRAHGMRPRDHRRGSGCHGVGGHANRIGDLSPKWGRYYSERYRDAMSRRSAAAGERAGPESNRSVMPRRRSSKHHPRPASFDRLRDELAAGGTRVEQASEPAPTFGYSLTEQSDRRFRAPMRAIEQAQIERHLTGTRAARHAALLHPCPSEHAAIGAYCFATSKGICGQRFDLGAADVLATGRMVAVGEKHAGRRA